MPAALAKNLTDFQDALLGPGFREAQRGLTSDALFIPADDPARKEKIVAGMSSAPQHVMSGCFRSMIGWDTASAVTAAAAVPFLYIAAQTWLGEAEKIRQLNPKVVFGQTVGAGHFNQLEVPDQVNGMIERFLAVQGSTSKRAA
jgi:pimeloyl-ACP methyl ester carboxylesterase